MTTQTFRLLVAFGLCWTSLHAKEPPASLPLVKGKTDLATLLPGVTAQNVAEHWQNSQYGIVVGKNGEILMVYSAKGEALLSASAWYLQGQSKDAEGKNVFTYMGSGEFFKGAIVPQATPEGYPLYEIKDAESDYLRWSRRIICKPGAIRVEMDFTPIKPVPEGVATGLQSRIKILAKTAEPFNQPNANPINVLTYNFSFDINYDPEMKWYKGYYIQGDTITFSPFFKSVYTVGQTVTLNYEITF